MHRPDTPIQTPPPKGVKERQKRALSVRNVYEKKFKTIALNNEWQAAIGQPELSGSWIIYGPSKHGKTSFALMLSKYLASYGKVLYITAEEGISLAFREAMKRNKMEEVDGKWFVFGSREIPAVADLIPVLHRQRSPEFVFVDSVLFYRMKQTEYRKLKKLFPHKLFVYVSHVNGNGEPKGATADEIWRDSMVRFSVTGFRAFPVSRYGGGETIDVNRELAEEYWGNVK